MNLIPFSHSAFILIQRKLYFYFIILFGEWFFIMFDIGNKHYEFFDMLNSHAKCFNEGAKVMHDVMVDYSTAQKKLNEIKDIEHKADDITAQTVAKLNQIFITPIDREDIFALSYGLDDGVDNLHGSIERLIMYDAGQPKTDGPAKLASLLIDATEELIKATEMLKDIRGNQHSLFDCTNRILKYESEGDEVYRKEMSLLFKTEKDPISLVKWKDILECLENTLDQAKHISDTLKGVVMKYA